MSFQDGIHRRFGATGRITFCDDGRRVAVKVDGRCSKCGTETETTTMARGTGSRKADAGAIR